MTTMKSRSRHLSLPRAVVLALSLALLGTACGEDHVKLVASTSVASQDTSAHFTLYSLGDGRYRALSELRVTWDIYPEGGGVSFRNTPFLDLQEPDSLTVSLGQRELLLEPQDTSDLHRTYVAEFTQDATSLVRFTYHRAEGDVVSEALLPAPFEILSPLPNDTVVREDGFQIATSAPFNGFFVSGDCIKDVLGLDLFGFGVSTDEHVSPEARSGHEDETCRVTVMVYMSQDGTVAPKFDPDTSWIKATQQRRVEIQVTP